MAFEPCDCHGQRFRGKSQHAYPAILGDPGIRGRVRLCPDGAKELGAMLRSYFTSDAAELAAFDVRDQCDLDGHDLVDGQARYAIYVTTYFDGGDRQDWVGRVCEAHLDQMALRLHLRA